MFFPFLADKEKLCLNNVQYVVQVFLSNFTSIMRNNTATFRCKPDFCGILSWGSNTYMNMHRFIIFVRPK